MVKIERSIRRFGSDSDFIEDFIVADELPQTDNESFGVLYIMALPNIVMTTITAVPGLLPSSLAQGSFRIANDAFVYPKSVRRSLPASVESISCFSPVIKNDLRTRMALIDARIW